MSFHGRVLRISFTVICEVDNPVKTVKMSEMFLLLKRIYEVQRTSFSYILDTD